MPLIRNPKSEIVVSEADSEEEVQANERESTSTVDLTLVDKDRKVGHVSRNLGTCKGIHAGGSSRVDGRRGQVGSSSSWVGT